VVETTKTARDDDTGDSCSRAGQGSFGAASNAGLAGGALLETYRVWAAITAPTRFGYSLSMRRS
jgi:hypothetical protein